MKKIAFSLLFLFVFIGLNAQISNVRTLNWEDQNKTTICQSCIYENQNKITYPFILSGLELKMKLSVPQSQINDLNP
ncbi:MAG: hypothetical protein R3A43_07220 [Bacteroidia bacterium]